MSWISWRAFRVRGVELLSASKKVRAKHGKAADAVNGLHGAVQVIGNSSSITDFFVGDRLLHLIFQNQIEDT